MRHPAGQLAHRLQLAGVQLPRLLLQGWPCILQHQHGAAGHAIGGAQRQHAGAQRHKTAIGVAAVQRHCGNGGLRHGRPERGLALRWDKRGKVRPGAGSQQRHHAWAVAQHPPLGIQQHARRSIGLEQELHRGVGQRRQGSSGIAPGAAQAAQPFGQSPHPRPLSFQT